MVLMPITIARVSDLVTGIEEGLIEMRTPVRMIIVTTRVSWIQCILFLKEVLKKGPLRNADTLFEAFCMGPMIVVGDVKMLTKWFL